MSQTALTFDERASRRKPVSPLVEMGAYEKLWLEPGMSFRKMAEKFRERPHALPSDLVDEAEAEELGLRILDDLAKRGASGFGVAVNHTADYPGRLRDAEHPLELFYFRGVLPLLESGCVAVVGTRRPSDEGRRRAKKLGHLLARDGWTLMSGLAEGIDGTVHRAALAVDRPTVAVIGTPLSEAYPREHAELQEQLARHHLVISQVPFERHRRGSPRTNKLFFPERNITMAALADATVIVEASDTSGTRHQARAALGMGRKLFILDSCFQDPSLRWPRKFEEQGAIRVADFEQIRDVLGGAPTTR